jgi:hypothetical protein
MTDLFIKPKPAAHISAWDIQDLLRKYYDPREWAIAFEVGNSTGFNCSRHADCVAMSLWPSRGISLHGIEIKVSKTDLKKELEQPEKADAIARFCDYWWIAAPAGLVDVNVLPLNWGLLEAGDKGLKIKKQAVKLDSIPATRGFFASLFRSVIKEDEARLERKVLERTAKLYDDAKESASRQVKKREEELAEKWKGLNEILKETGIPQDSLQWRQQGFIEAVKKVQAHRDLPDWKVKNLIKFTERFLTEIKEIDTENEGAAL